MLKWCQFNKQAIDAVCHLPSETQMWQGVKLARSEFQIWAKLLLESCEFTLLQLIEIECVETFCS
jgi:hypothetical protein